MRKLLTDAVSLATAAYHESSHPTCRTSVSWFHATNKVKAAKDIWSLQPEALKNTVQLTGLESRMLRSGQPVGYRLSLVGTQSEVTTDPPPKPATTLFDPLEALQEELAETKARLQTLEETHASCPSPDFCAQTLVRIETLRDQRSILDEQVRQLEQDLVNQRLQFHNDLEDEKVRTRQAEARLERLQAQRTQDLTQADEVAHRQHQCLGATEHQLVVLKRFVRVMISGATEEQVAKVQQTMSPEELQSLADVFEPG